MFQALRSMCVEILPVIWRRWGRSRQIVCLVRVWWTACVRMVVRLWRWRIVVDFGVDWVLLGWRRHAWSGVVHWTTLLPPVLMLLMTPTNQATTPWSQKWWGRREANARQAVHWKRKRNCIIIINQKYTMVFKNELAGFFVRFGGYSILPKKVSRFFFSWNSIFRPSCANFTFSDRF